MYEINFIYLKSCNQYNPDQPSFSGVGIVDDKVDGQG